MANTIKKLIYPENLLLENSRYGDQFMVLYINEPEISPEEYITNSGNSVFDVNGDPIRTYSGSIVDTFSKFQGGRMRGLGMKTSYGIFLPVPLDIKTNFGVTYKDDFEVGTELAKIAGNAIDQTLNPIPDILGKQAKDDARAGGATKKDAKSIGNMKAAKIQGYINLFKSAAPLVGKALYAAGGIAMNPHKELLFEGVNFRKFDFTYKLIAKNKKETELIKEIISLLRFHMHPDSIAGNFLFRYPSEFDVEFYFRKEKTGGNATYVRNPYLTFLSTCVIESLDVNYSNGNYVAFKDTGAPVEITIKINLKETQIMTKEVINRFVKYIEDETLSG